MIKFFGLTNFVGLLHLLAMTAHSDDHTIPFIWIVALVLIQSGLGVCPETQPLLLLVHHQLDLRHPTPIAKKKT